jgi:hypothetical protein
MISCSNTDHIQNRYVSYTTLLQQQSDLGNMLRCSQRRSLQSPCIAQEIGSSAPQRIHVKGGRSPSFYLITLPEYKSVLIVKNGYIHNSILG